MKKILLPILALAVLASCSKHESDESPSGRVPIRLGAGVEASTKAHVVSGSSVNAGIAGWEATGTVDYSAATAWATDITVTADPATGQAVSWTAQPYYNAANTIKTYMKAWYPKGTLMDLAVSFTNTDGSVDALLAPTVNGSKDDASGKALAFAHKTTQVSFQVKAGAGLESGTKIKKITLKGVQLPTGFDLTKESTDAGAVTWATAGNLEIPNLTEAEITTTAASAGDPVMFKPWEDNSLTVDIETDKATYTAKTFTTSDDKLGEGSAYVVTLTFSQTEIELTATIADWIAATGAGEIK